MKDQAFRNEMYGINILDSITSKNKDECSQALSQAIIEISNAATTLGCTGEAYNQFMTRGIDAVTCGFLNHFNNKQRKEMIQRAMRIVVDEAISKIQSNNMSMEA